MVMENEERCGGPLISANRSEYQDYAQGQDELSVWSG
jgi:hypothetical protein